MLFAENKTAFAFFGAGLPSEVHCFDCYLVSEVCTTYLWFDYAETEVWSDFTFSLCRQLSQTQYCESDPAQIVTVVIYDNERHEFFFCNGAVNGGRS